jgi:release factor glutamine methyltransferase
MTTDQAVVALLRAAGCVFAEDEARLLTEAARSPAELDVLVQRRVSGLPLEQVVGWAEFHGLRIFVDPGVFVPRRRSEFLVDTAVSLARQWSSSMGDSRSPHGGLPARRIPPGPPSPPGPVIVDLCCGTGALGLAVATALGGAGPTGIELHAADIDPAAVACARRNLEPAGGHVYLGDLFGPLPMALRGRVGLLICNAPYVPSPEVTFLPPEARDYEPRGALDGGPDGLAVLRRVAAAAPRWLGPGGSLLVETSDEQAPDMTEAITAARLTARVHSSEEYGATVVTGST